MPHTAPTPADLKARFPKFANVSDPVIQQALTEASRMVDETWNAEDFALGQMLYAAHVLTQDGHGSGTEAELNAEGVGDFQSISLGSLSLSRFAKSGSRAVDATTKDLQSTTFGARFLVVLARNAGGPLIAGAEATGISARARDVPNLPGLARIWPGNG